MTVSLVGRTAIGSDNSIWPDLVTHATWRQTALSDHHRAFSFTDIANNNSNNNKVNLNTEPKSKKSLGAAA